MKKLSVIIITLNEEKNIRECLEGVQWADEIVVVDSRSSDNTCQIARNFTDKVFTVDWLGFSGTKNYALEKAEGQWVLWLDADERVPEELAQEIQKAIQSDEVDGFYLPRKAYFLGRWIRHCGWYPGYVLRLFKREKARFNDALVHEGLEFQGKTGKLKTPLLHYTDRAIEHYFSKFNHYTTLAAQQLLQKGKQFRLMDLLFRPLHTFFRMYFLKLGFLDGIQGVILSVFSACYVFTKYAKLWELERNPEQ
ncbi:MAG: glycosyltransferase family 2 protein [candidate division KSB1 bacterium]|nr:glycosyltransferase family 2 protein [candidate division KSB1 bacterium]